MRNAAAAALLLAFASAAAMASAPAGEAQQALLAKIEQKWRSSLTAVRGWNEQSFRHFREGYAAYPVEVLEKALAAPTYEELQDGLDAHAAVIGREAMAKAMRKTHAVGLTLPADGGDARVAEAKRIAAKALGDDARDLLFIPITPCTVWDTRFATDPDSMGIINNGQTRKFFSHLSGAGGSYAAYGGNPSCPETAQNAIGPRPFAVMMTVYVNDATANGWLTFYRDGDPDPSLATISMYYSPGPTRTQTVISKSSRGYGSGAYDIAATSRYGNAHASASITGYFVKAQGAGTVTSVATGAGLTGGPITDSGTIGLADTNRLPTTPCAANQMTRWDGAGWACVNMPSAVMSGRIANPANEVCLVGAPSGLSNSAPCHFSSIPLVAGLAPAGLVVRNFRARIDAPLAVAYDVYLLFNQVTWAMCTIPPGGLDCSEAGPSGPLGQGRLHVEAGLQGPGTPPAVSFVFELAPS